jgi:hypothetical protein
METPPCWVSCWVFSWLSIVYSHWSCGSWYNHCH